jgi:hypothetical protein
MSLFSLRGVAKLTEIILLMKERLGHDVKPRALVTMFDFRTRYAKQVLEKVKDRFGHNVFQSVIRYNIRLRETVDYGLPIGDYDKRSIGNLDYGNLAEEVIGSEEGTLLSAQEILSHTERYIEQVTSMPQEEASGQEDETEEAGEKAFPEEACVLQAGPREAGGRLSGGQDRETGNESREKLKTLT